MILVVWQSNDSETFFGIGIITLTEDMMSNGHTISKETAHRKTSVSSTHPTLDDDQFCRTGLNFEYFLIVFPAILFFPSFFSLPVLLYCLIWEGF
jgi:hypothetical protein